MKKDLTGMRYGRLVVLRETGPYVSESGRTRRRWLCQCDCGNEVTVIGDNLTGGKTLSCGCYRNDRLLEVFGTHKESGSRLYGVWCSMKSRCGNPNVPTYQLYGGRGVQVCDEWEHSYESFRNWAYENGYDETAARGECTIDRIDCNGNYEPSNCRVVSQREQMNNVRYNRRYTYNGENHTIAEWARIVGMPYQRLLDRLTRYGLDIEKALTQ